MTNLKVNVSDQGIQTIDLNRPEKHHALNVTMIHELVDAFAKAFDDDEIKCVILKSSGPVFCAGADLHDMHQRTDDLIDALIALIRVLQQKNKPLYVPLTGSVYGGGSIILSFADVIMASDRVEIVMPEIKSQLWPVFLMPLLKKHLPHGVLMPMAMHAEPLSAKRAYALGWFNGLDSQDHTVLETIEALAKKYCQIPLASLKAFYACHQWMEDQPLSDETLTQLGFQLKSLVSIKALSTT